jgi:murein DD-endopeptidase MepM/ murein hydrolase activator NlpD
MKPTEGWVSSVFGQRAHPFKKLVIDHKGIDFSNNEGTPIVAPADGIVRFAGKNGSFGFYLSINHAFGFVTKYGHLGKILVRLRVQQAKSFLDKVSEIVIILKKLQRK